MSIESELILAVVIPCGLGNAVSSMEKEEANSEIILFVGETGGGRTLGEGKRGSLNPGGSRLLVGRNDSELGRGGIKRGWDGGRGGIKRGWDGGRGGIKKGWDGGRG